MRNGIVLVSALALIFCFPEASLASRGRKKAKVPVVEAPVDWGQQAARELAAAKNIMAKPAAKSRMSTTARAVTSPPAGEPVVTSQLKSGLASGLASGPQNLTGTGSSDVLPTAATVRAEVDGARSIIERSALRFTFLFEPYQPSGTAKLAGGQSVQYSNLPTTVLGQVDLRWLPFEIGSIRDRPVLLGGYVAGGYSRSSVPLVAPSGFRFEDVAVSTIRFEGGVSAGMSLREKWNLEARAGVGRVLVTQTSKYSDVVGSYDRPFLVGAFDVSYYFNTRFALVGSMARRTPLSDGKGSIAFDPLTVSGGFLVQVR